MIRNSYSPDTPFSVPRIVQWGECDPAGMVYTTQFLDYVMETLEAFWRAEIGLDFQRLHRELGLGSPTVSTRLDFQRALRAGDEFRVELRILKISRSTISFLFQGRSPAGEICFTAEHVSCIVDEARLKSVPIPDRLRLPLEAYLAATQTPAKDSPA